MAKLNLTEGPGIKLKKDVTHGTLNILGTADVVNPPANYSIIANMFSDGRTPILDGRITTSEKGTRYIYPVNRGWSNIHYASPVYKNEYTNEYNIVFIDYSENESEYTKEVKTLGVIKPLTGIINFDGSVALNEDLTFDKLNSYIFDEESNNVKMPTPITIYLKYLQGGNEILILPFTFSKMDETSQLITYYFYNPMGITINEELYKYLVIKSDGTVVLETD